MDKIQIIEKIKTDDNFVIGALVRIHRDRLYYGFERGILSSFASRYLKTGSLSEKQLKYARKAIQKYWQYLDGDLSQPVQKWEKKPKTFIRNATLSKEGRRIEIELTNPIESNIFKKCSKEIEAILFCKYISQKKKYFCPLNHANIKVLKKLKFDISEDLQNWYYKNLKITEVEIPELDDSLYPFQYECVDFTESREGNVIIGDQMGLGKTVEALAWLRLNFNERPIIIIVPASLKLNWKKESEKWLSDEVIKIANGRKPNLESYEDTTIFIINYDILSFWQEFIIKKIKPVGIIFDEAHYVQNKKANRTKAIKAIIKKCKYVLPLSGTPITSYPAQFYEIINMVDPTIFPDRQKFLTRYCQTFDKHGQIDYKGAQNTDELHKILTDTILIRRLKKDVLKDLPPKRRIVVPLEIDNRQEYELAEKNIEAWLKSEEKKEVESRKERQEEIKEKFKDVKNTIVDIMNAGKEGEGEYFNELKDIIEEAETIESLNAKGKKSKNKTINTLARIEKIKQIIIKGKMKGIISWIEDYLEVENKLVVFATHRKTVFDITNHFKKKAVKVMGGMSNAQKQKSVDDFQNKKSIKLIIGNLKALGTGHTLTKANSTATVELGWIPGDHEQAEDRVHRIGQEADSVNAYYLIADNTYEEEIISLLDQKMIMLAAVLDGQVMPSNSILGDLLKAYKNK